MKTKKNFYKWLPMISFVCLAIFGVVLRSLFITKISEFPIIIDNALILDKSFSSLNVFNMEHIYTSMYTIFFSFVGNKAEMAMYFQIILQVIAIIFIYFSIKEFTNKTCAWICYLVFICSPFVFLISINQLFLLIFSILFGLSAIYVHIIRKKERSITLKWMFSFFIALMITRFLLIDTIYIVFIIFGLLISVFYTTSEYPSNIKAKVICTLTYVVGIIGSIVIYFTIEYAVRDGNIKNEIFSFLKNIFTYNSQKIEQIIENINNLNFNALLIYGIVIVVLSFVMISFLQEDKKSSIVLTILLVSLCLYWMFFKTSINPYMAIVLLGFSLFVLGIQTIVYLIRAKKISNQEIVEPKQNNMELDFVQEIETEKNDNLIIKTNFIDNPLPVPKKHIAKTLTYKFEPNPEDMHYDLEN